MFIRVEESGAISVGTGSGQEGLDTDPNNRELPLLSQRVELYKTAANAGNSQPLVQVFVENNTPYQRVVDVLNVLSKFEIDKVTFTDLMDTE